MDPALSELILEAEAAGEDPVVEAVIRTREPGIEIPDVRMVARFGTVSTCRLLASDVAGVRDDPRVLSLKAARVLGPEDLPRVEGAEHPSSSTEAGSAAHDRRSLVPAPRRPSSLRATGAGVLVGAVDWGLDVAHPSFLDGRGRTRVRALWDQRPSSGTPPEPYGYGTLHSKHSIDAALLSGRPYQELGYELWTADRGGGTHGTHVMDIAAGSGPVPGVAPGADLAFVHLADRGTSGLANLGDSVHLLEGVEFLARTAGSQPWAVNISVGRHGGPHDGSTLVEVALDELLASRPGCFIAQSVGNYYRARAHAQGRLTDGGVRTIAFDVDAGDATPNELEIWYPGVDELLVSIAAPGAEPVDVPLGERAVLLAPGGVVVGRVHHRRHDPNNGDHHIDAFLASSPAGVGRWRVTLTARHVASGRFHAWLERDEACGRCQARFTPTDSARGTTTGTLANGHLPLVVGAYDAAVRGCPPAPFTSAGPTRDNRLKPDLTAPGVGIVAARSAPPGSISSPGGLTVKSGSSMATPHVTGAAALCLEAGRGALTAQELRRLLLDTASPPTSESTARLGRGRLNITALVAAAKAQTAAAAPIRGG